tara:strand:- start:1 stop:474 length:474 start_codon:yes stop_codon:yes gene_type:complete
MKSDHLNIYNNLIKLTRNKNLYYNLKNRDTFSDRLIIFMFHFSFFLKRYKSEMSSDYSQTLFDFVVRQIELSIREIGYGDVSVNKKMKEYVNLFYSILEKIENWDSLENSRKIALIADFININEGDDLFVNYFNKYEEILLNNSFKIFIKEIIEIKI